MSKVYTSSNGSETLIEKLADTHLVNILRKIEKIGEPHPLYNDLKSELEKRPEQTRNWYAERVANGK